MTKHGNISIEKVKSGNFTYYKLRQVGKYEKTCMSFDESELHDLELCLHKLKITESDKLWEKETKNFNN